MAQVLLPFSLQGVPVHQAVTAASNPFAITPTSLQSLSTTMYLKNYGANNVFVVWAPTVAGLVAVANQGFVLSPNEGVSLARGTDVPNGAFFMDAVCGATLTSNLMVALGIGVL